MGDFAVGLAVSQPRSASLHPLPGPARIHYPGQLVTRVPRASLLVFRTRSAHGPAYEQPLQPGTGDTNVIRKSMSDHG
jgi:hypothetical protein